MSKNKYIFIIGSCSAHIGNWEQQLGNAAILIGLLDSIHKNLPGAVVIKSIPAGVVVAGNPARIINSVDNFPYPKGT